jgi:broad specificity phosphatase PhoE
MEALQAKCDKGAPLPMKKKTVNVIIFWMRHSYSCSNCLAFQNKDSEIMAAIQKEIQDTHKDPGEPTGYAEGWRDMRDKLLRNAVQAATKGIEKEYEDPSITDLGVLRAQELGGPIIRMIVEKTGWSNPPILCSSMVRAMETSLYAFPNKPVHVIPYIAEVDSREVSKTNTPLKYEDQMAKLRRSGSDVSQLLKFDLAPRDHPHRASSSKDSKDNFVKNSYVEFKNFMPSALEQLWSQINSGGEHLDVPDEIPVVVVGHGSFMKTIAAKECDFGKGERVNAASKSMGFENNEVTAQTYTVEWGAWDAQLEPVDKCGKWECGTLFTEDQTPRDDSVFFPPSDPNELCEADVARCKEDGDQFVPQRMLDRHKDKDACKSGQTILQRDKIRPLNYVEVVRGLKHDSHKSWEEEGLLDITAKSALKVAKQALKVAMQIEVRKFAVTTLTAEASANSQVLTIASKRGFKKGDIVVISARGNLRQRTRIVRFGSNSMNLTDRLEFNCPIGTSVLRVLTQAEAADRQAQKMVFALTEAIERAHALGVKDTDETMKEAMEFLGVLGPESLLAKVRASIGSYSERERKPRVRLPEAMSTDEENKLRGDLERLQTHGKIGEILEDEHPELANSRERQRVYYKELEAKVTAGQASQKEKEELSGFDETLQDYYRKRNAGRGHWEAMQGPSEMSTLQTYSDAQTGRDTNTAQVAMDARGHQRVLSEVKRHE